MPIIERAGGAVLAAQTVDEILVERGTAVGVRCHNTIKPHLPPHEFRAPLVISGAGADVTYNKLLPASVPIPFRAELQAQSNGVSAVCVYLGLKDSPATLGVKGENHWVYGGYDHDAALTSGKLGHGYYLSFPSLKNPKAHARGHTADIITFAAYEPFKQWAEGQWKKRGEDYEALKRQIAEQLIGQVDEHLPGFADLVSYPKNRSYPIPSALFWRNPTVGGGAIPVNVRLRCSQIRSQTARELNCSVVVATQA